jgi:hypothetical protein
MVEQMSLSGTLYVITYLVVTNVLTYAGERNNSISVKELLNGTALSVKYSSETPSAGIRPEQFIHCLSSRLCWIRPSDLL